MGLNFEISAKLLIFTVCFKLRPTPTQITMKKTLLLVPFVALFLSMTPPNDFYENQLKFTRVQEAHKLKGKAVEALLKEKGINSSEFDLFLRAFKKEKVLEVWAKNKDKSEFTLLKTYDFCATTGILGPKRRSGDRQMPEGFYKVDLFNPNSQYLLSFRINYPNASDKKFADPINPGDSIFIHGHCVTIGCIPVGDDNIKELYLLAIKAKSSGNDINVHIFPTKLDDASLSALKSENPQNADFWTNLKPGFDAFESTKMLPKVSVGDDGKYIVN